MATSNEAVCHRIVDLAERLFAPGSIFVLHLRPASDARVVRSTMASSSSGSKRDWRVQTCRFIPGFGPLERDTRMCESCDIGKIRQAVPRLYASHSQYCHAS